MAFLSAVDALDWAVTCAWDRVSGHCATFSSMFYQTVVGPTDVAVDSILQEGAAGGEVAKPVAPHALHEQGSRVPLFEGNRFPEHGQMCVCHGVGNVSIWVEERKGEA
jgi:hypothetical protein